MAVIFLYLVFFVIFTGVIMRVYLFSALVLFIVSFNLSGCGTKGALYIPEQRYPQDTNN